MTSGPAGVERLHHVGVVVGDLATALELVRRAFRLEVSHELNASDLRAAFLQCGEVSIELIEPIGDGARERRLGAGGAARIEHIAFEVESLQQAVEALDAMGVRTTRPPKPGPGYRSVWTEPASSDGVMYQLLELDPAVAPASASGGDD